MDAEVEVGTEVGADSPFVHHADSWSDPLAYRHIILYVSERILGYVIYTTRKSCYLVDSVWDTVELDALPSIVLLLVSRRVLHLA